VLGPLHLTRSLSLLLVFQGMGKQEIVSGLEGTKKGLFFLFPRRRFPSPSALYSTFSPCRGQELYAPPP